MRGELGVFYVDDKKVGGCLGWEMHIEISDGIDNAKRITSWITTTQKYWFTKKSRQVLACFFWIHDGRAVLAYKGLLTINADIDNIEKMINGNLEFMRCENGK